MPLKKTKKKAVIKNKQIHVGFFPFLTLVFISWLIYRSLFQFPVWFDESVGKAIFFGLPVWFYMIISGSSSISDTFSVYKFKKGVLLGIAVGGIFGFSASIFSLISRGGVVESSQLFTSDIFWREFVLALLTGFWETLLFFSLTQTVIQEKFSKWSVFNQVFLVAAIFTIFHLPNILINFQNQIVAQALLMFMFSMGQAFLFHSRRNAYALILSHAIWGMVLLVHFW